MAKFAVFSGVEQTARKFGLAPEELTTWVQQLDFSGLKLLTELRTLVRSITCRKGIRSAASELGLSESLLEEFMKSEGSIETQIVQKSNCETQTPVVLPRKRPRTTTETQTGEAIPPPPQEPILIQEPVIIQDFTPAEKIKAVRSLRNYPSLEAASAALNIPTQLLDTWKMQIKTCCFQAPHVEQLYVVGAKGQNSLYQELDHALFKSWGANYKAGMDVDQFLLERVKKIAKVDSAEPNISPAWLTHFKSFYNIQ